MAAFAHLFEVDNPPDWNPPKGTKVAFRENRSTMIYRGAIISEKQGPFYLVEIEFRRGGEWRQKRVHAEPYQLRPIFGEAAAR
jgi:hypothetical protein